jgi:hypothetical protein
MLVAAAMVSDRWNALCTGVLIALFAGGFVTILQSGIIDIPGVLFIWVAVFIGVGLVISRDWFD